MIVFAGPTVSPRDAPGFEFRPPAAQGDLYCAARERPAAIGLIDGYFDERPAVLHKEILWALAEGIPVYGAASMGALRAAELHTFGMRGIGLIFEDYRDGRLIADDAVALEHGPPETGYVSLSEPLVNIEATLARAVRDGVATARDADALRERARALHYRDRTWQAVLDASTSADLASWVSVNRVDQKRLDALEMLAAMKVARPASPPDFRFQHTELWQDVIDRAGPGSTVAAAEREHLHDEVRLAAGIEDLRWRAMTRRLLRKPASTRPASGSAVSTLRRKLGLYRKEALDRWLAANCISEHDFNRLAAEDVTLSFAQDRHWVDAMIDELRLAGRLDPIRHRARRKQAVLAARGREDSATDGAGLWSEAGLAGLVAWYCRVRGQPTPDDIDAFGRRLGFEDRPGLQRALARERLYRLSGDEQSDAAATAAQGARDD